MKNREALEKSLMAINAYIDAYFKEDITRPYDTCEHLGESLWGLVGMYRRRALLQFLLEANVNGFFEDLLRQALSYLTLLKAYYQGMDVRKSRVNGYTEEPLVGAMAAGHFELAREIDSLMPKQLDAPEGEMFFAYTMLLRALAAADESRLLQALQRFEATCAGNPRLDPKIAMFKPLVHRDAKGFNEALIYYLESFKELSPAELDDLDTGAADIDITALAVVQVARLLGVPVSAPHRMLPPELIHPPRVSISAQSYPAWP